MMFVGGATGLGYAFLELAATGVPGCRKTPYYDFRTATAEQPAFERRAVTEAQKAVAQRELDFLKSLLPDANRTDEKDVAP